VTKRIADDPELYDGLTLTSATALSAQIRQYGAPPDLTTVLVLAPHPDEERTSSSGRAEFEVDGYQARMLRDLLNIATARGFL
jgi:hypothetical protein